MSKIVIVGGPRCGKTRRSETMAGTVRHTDDLIGRLNWSDASAEVARWMTLPGPWVIEGVATARALRKALQSMPTGKPCDVVQLMFTPFEHQNPGQASMHAGVKTVWDEISLQLRQRGVVITG